MEKNPRYNLLMHENLFKGFHSFDKPNLNGVVKLQKELSKYPEFKPRLTFHFPLDKERVEAIEILKSGEIKEDFVSKLAKSKDFVKQLAGDWLLKNKGIQVQSLEEEFRDSKFRDFFSYLWDKSTDFEKNKHRWLLGTQKALFATPYTKDLVDELMGLQKLSLRVKEKFSDKFIGLNVIGSAYKGYFKNTDIDFFAFISKDIKEDDITEINNYFSKELLSKPMYEFHGVIYPDVDNSVFSAGLFKGLFFGDHDELTRLQKKILEKIYKYEGREIIWDDIRSKIMYEETNNLDKLADRFRLSIGEQERIRIMTILSRVPPTYEETLKIVSRNEKRLPREKKC